MIYFENLNLYSNEDIDDYIITLFYTKSGRLNSNLFTEQWKNSNKEIFDYLEKRYIDSESVYESLYRIKNKLEVRPTCIICGGKVKFIKSYGFSKHCSAKCSACDTNTREKYKKTCKEKYNVENYTKTADYKKKTVITSLERYGVEHPTKREEYKNKIREDSLRKYGVDSYFKTSQFKEKSKATCKNKYGKEFITQTEVFKEKSKATCIEHYGTSYYLTSDDCLEKTKQSQNKVKGYYGSKKENILYNILIEKFQIVEREYSSKEYPYHCDFYIPSINLYIEFNGMWVHGKHPYNKNNIDDIKKLEYMNNKAKTSSYYKRAIKIWTEEDVNKREYAKSHNLKWIEGWTIDEVLDKILNTKY